MSGFSHNFQRNFDGRKSKIAVGAQLDRNKQMTYDTLMGTYCSSKLLHEGKATRRSCVQAFRGKQKSASVQIYIFDSKGLPEGKFGFDSRTIRIKGLLQADVKNFDYRLPTIN